MVRLVDGRRVSCLRFTKELIALRRRHPVFRRRRYSTGKEAADLRWFTPSGTEMTAENWADPNARSVALFIDGSTDPDVGADGTPMVDNDFLVLINAWWEPLTFTVPGRSLGAPVGCRLRHLRPCAEGHCRARAYGRAAVNRDLAVAIELSTGGASRSVRVLMFVATRITAPQHRRKDHVAKLVRWCLQRLLDALSAPNPAADPRRVSRGRCF